MNRLYTRNGLSDYVLFLYGLSVKKWQGFFVYYLLFMYTDAAVVIWV